MAYDEGLVERLDTRLVDGPGLTRKKMFGGVGYLLHGNMLVGVWKDSLIARVGPDAYDAARALPHTAEFDITGRAMKGWVLVQPDGIAEEDDLDTWIERARAFVTTLPGKA